MHDFSVVYKREDGSYVIDSGLYHVPNEGDFAELWGEVHKHVTDHPEVLAEEPVFEPEIRHPNEPGVSMEARMSAVEDGLAELAELIVEALYD